MNQQILFTMIWFHSLVLFLPLSMFLLYKWPKLWHHLLAIFLGIITGLIDLQSDEIQLPALLLIIFGFFLGFGQPKGAWIWAIFLSIWIPAFEMASIISQGTYEKLFDQGIFSFIAIIPAMIGAYAGVIIQASVRSGENAGPTTNVQTKN